MRNLKYLFLIIPFIIISCATKQTGIKKEDTKLGSPVEVTRESPSPPPSEIKPEEKRSEEKPTPSISTPLHTTEKREGFVLLNFDNADLKDIVSLVSEATGVNFIIATGVTAKITIHSAEKIPASELFPIFESILEMNGLAAVKSGHFYIIVQKGRELPFIESTRIRLFTPKNVDVRTLSRELTYIVNAITLGKEGISLIPLERLNKLIIFSPSEKSLQTIEEWAKRLDEEIAPSGLMTYVYSVQNVKAKEIAEVLKAIYETKEGVKPITPTTTITPTPTPTPPKTAVSTTPTPRPTQKVEVSETRGTGEIKIVVYEPTNSLVVLASLADYKQIIETIKMLDVYPKQVLIEVLIAEVSLTEETRFGIQWSLLSQDRAKVLGETHAFEGLAQMRSSKFPEYSISTEGILSTTASGYSYLLYEAGRVTAMLHALATEGKVNILSTPHLLVKDNQEANIDVGMEIPVATGTSQQTTTEATVVQNIQYKTVGVKLKMKPVINDEKTVVLDITQEVSEYSSDVTVGKEGYTYPAFSKREAKTAIVVGNSQSIVIGGIMKEISKRDYEGIPILSKIPLLGYLFRYTVTKNEKTELIMLLTPHVVKSKTEADIVTEEFKEKVKGLKKPLRKLEKEEEKKDKKEESQPSE